MGCMIITGGYLHVCYGLFMDCVLVEIRAAEAFFSILLLVDL